MRTRGNLYAVCHSHLSNYLGISFLKRIIVIFIGCDYHISLFLAYRSFVHYQVKYQLTKKTYLYYEHNMHLLKKRSSPKNMNMRQLDRVCILYQDRVCILYQTLFLKIFKVISSLKVVQYINIIVQFDMLSSLILFDEISFQLTT